MSGLKFFIAGIIQGSIRDDAIHAQTYRDRLRELLRNSFPDSEVYCPFEEHPESLRYSHDEGRQTFFDLMGKAGQTDVLVAFLPEASMGTAIEIWNAHQSGALVVCISPLVGNWVIKFLSDEVFETLEDFEQFVRDGGLASLLRKRREPSP